MVGGDRSQARGHEAMEGDDPQDNIIIANHRQELNWRRRRFHLPHGFHRHRIHGDSSRFPDITRVGVYITKSTAIMEKREERVNKYIEKRRRIVE